VVLEIRKRGVYITERTVGVGREVGIHKSMATLFHSLFRLFAPFLVNDAFKPEKRREERRFGSWRS
jgi:hypothetical protein